MENRHIDSLSSSQALVNPASPLLTATEVGRILRLSKFSIYRKAGLREIGHIRIGHKLFFLREHINEFLEKRRIAAKD